MRGRGDGASAVRFTVFALVGVMFAGGCASTSGEFLGLATVSYVDAEIAGIEQAEAKRAEEQRAELERISAELERISAELDMIDSRLETYDRLSEEIRHVLTDFTEVQSATAELQLLAVEVSERLAELPRETVRQIVDALQASLEDSEEP